MSADGNYISRTRVELADRERRAEMLRANKRAITADVLRAELDAKRAPAGVDLEQFMWVVSRVIAGLESP